MWDWKRLFGTTSSPSTSDRLLEQLSAQNATLLEALIADSARKTELLDRIVASRFDRPVMGSQNTEQPESIMAPLLRASILDGDDADFIAQATEAIGGAE